MPLGVDHVIRRKVETFIPRVDSLPVTLSVPETPTGVIGAVGNTMVYLTWNAPYNGGAGISNYEVTANPGGLVTNTASTSCNFLGLTNGVAYTFTVVATNSEGDSPASAPSAAVTPVAPPAATVPNAPTGVIGMAKDEQVSLSWDVPPDGGSVITGYTVTSNPEGLTFNTVIPSCNFTGLTNGTAYTFTVVATNAIGDSLPSAPSGSITPAVPPVIPTPPEAPTAPVASSGDAQATVTWDAPFDGNSDITGYTVTSNPEGIVVNTTDLTCQVTGLTNGVSYIFMVVATNAVGNSPSSPASNSVTPEAPASVTVVESTINGWNPTSNMQAQPTRPLNEWNNENQNLYKNVYYILQRRSTHVDLINNSQLAVFWEGSTGKIKGLRLFGGFTDTNMSGGITALNQYPMHRLRLVTNATTHDDYILNVENGWFAGQFNGAIAAAHIDLSALDLDMPTSWYNETVEDEPRSIEFTFNIA